MHMDVNGRFSNKLPVVILGTVRQGTSGFETRSRERKWGSWWKRRRKEAEELVSANGLHNNNSNEVGQNSYYNKKNVCINMVVKRQPENPLNAAAST